MKKLKTIIIICLFSISLFGQEAKLSTFTNAFISYWKNDFGKTDVPINRAFKVQQGIIPTINAFIELTQGADLQKLTAMGVEINAKIDNVVTAKLPVNLIETLCELPEIKRIEVAVPVSLKMDDARIKGNVDKLHAGTDELPSIKGKGVVVGIVDMGLEYGHANFYDTQHSTLRLKRVWNQNSNRKYDSENTILSATRDVSNETHATHVMGIAAGADMANGNKYYGIASEADLVFVSLNSSNDAENVDVFNGVKYIFDYAESVNKPCVANLSLGSHYGPHDGTSYFDRMIDNIVGEGRILVGSAGNEGDVPLHVSKSLTGSSDNLNTFLNFPYNYYKMGNISFWGDVGKDFDIQVVVYQKSTSTEVYASPILNAATSSSRTFNINVTGASGNITIYTERDPNNNKANAFLQVYMSSLSNGYYVGFKITSPTENVINGWTDGYYSEFSNQGVSGWTTGNTSSTVGEIGGSGKRIISVGAFNSKIQYTSISGNTYSTGEMLNRICSFSSKGPTADGRIKPDITAPGSILVASYQNTSSIQNSDLVFRNTINGTTYNYGAMSGTSMSSPFVAGVVALWLQIKSDLTPEQIRDVLTNASITDTYTGNISAEGNNTWGHGKVDAYNGALYIINKYGIDPPDPDPEGTEPKLLYTYTKDGNLSFFFPNEEKNVILQVVSLEGKSLYYKSLGNINESHQEDFKVSLPNGVYLVFVKTDSFAKAEKFIMAQ